MSKYSAIAAILTASTFLTTGVALAASSQTAAPASQPSPVQKDFRTLSKDGAKAYLDLKLGRLAIFDGQIDQAKKYISAADAGFAKAKSDDSVFSEAENKLQGGDQSSAEASSTGQAMSQPTTSRSVSNGQASGTGMTKTDPTEAQQWIPVDGEMSLAEDFTGNQAKTAAVADANKSLKAGDRKGAAEKLKLAGIDVDVVVAVLPVQPTAAKIHQASEDLQNGKYYEASQELRQIEDSVRFDVADISGTPKAAAAGDQGAAAKAAPQSDKSGSEAGAAK